MHLGSPQAAGHPGSPFDPPNGSASLGLRPSPARRDNRANLSQCPSAALPDCHKAVLWGLIYLLQYQSLNRRGDFGLWLAISFVMSTYQLELPVPVEWDDYAGDFRFGWKSLKAGTLLEARPMALRDAVEAAPDFVRVRVGGRHGLVPQDRLQAALPEWKQ